MSALHELLLYAHRVCLGSGGDSDAGAYRGLVVSLFEALAEWVGQPAHFTAGLGRQPGRFGAAHATIAPYGPYDDADGHTILLAIQNEPEWERFCRTVLERPDLVVDERFARNSRRVDHRDELDVIVAECIGRLNTVVAETKLAEAGVAFAGVNTVSEFLEHPVLEARDRWRSVDTEKGSVRALLPPIGLGEEARMGPVPAHGAHTTAVLRELGLDTERIDALRDRGIINQDSIKEEVGR